MVAQNFQVLAKLGFCSNCSQNFSGCSFARARIFLQVLACSVFDKGSFRRVLAARKANYYRCSCSPKKALCSHARKCSQRPFDTPFILYIHLIRWFKGPIKRSQYMSQHSLNIHLIAITLS